MGLLSLLRGDSTGRIAWRMFTEGSMAWGGAGACPCFRSQATQLMRKTRGARRWDPALQCAEPNCGHLAVGRWGSRRGRGCTAETVEEGGFGGSTTPGFAGPSAQSHDRERAEPRSSSSSSSSSSARRAPRHHPPTVAPGFPTTHAGAPPPAPPAPPHLPRRNAAAAGASSRRGARGVTPAPR